MKHDAVQQRRESEPVRTFRDPPRGEVPTCAGCRAVVRGHPCLAKRLLIEVLPDDIGDEPVRGTHKATDPPYASSRRPTASWAGPHVTLLAGALMIRKEAEDTNGICRSGDLTDILVRSAGYQPQRDTPRVRGVDALRVSHRRILVLCTVDQ